MAFDESGLKKDLQDAFETGLSGDSSKPSTADEVAQNIAFAIIAYADQIEYQLSSNLMVPAAPSPVTSPLINTKVKNMAAMAGSGALLNACKASLKNKDKYAAIAAAIPVYISTFAQFGSGPATVSTVCVPGPAPDFQKVIDVGLAVKADPKNPKQAAKDTIPKIAEKMANEIHKTFKASTVSVATVLSPPHAVPASLPGPFA